MMRAGFRWATITLILGLMLTSSLFIGCNEGANFDPDLLFSLEDYADDTDYANVYIDMMNRWYRSMSDAKAHLAGNVTGIPFVDAVPDGWRPIEESEVFSQLAGFQTDWYFTSFQDASYELIRFDQDVPDTAPYHPASVDYGRLKYQMDPLGGRHLNGDLVNLGYTDNYSNRSACEGGSYYGSVEVLFFTQGTGTLQNFPAGMVNQWSATISNASAIPNNPSATFTLEGLTVIVRVDTQDQVQQDITGEAVIRANGRGTGNVVVNGIERVRFVFESYDSAFHGYVTTSSTDFQERLSF